MGRRLSGDLAAWPLLAGVIALLDRLLIAVSVATSVAMSEERSSSSPSRLRPDEIVCELRAGFLPRYASRDHLASVAALDRGHGVG